MQSLSHQIIGFEMNGDRKKIHNNISIYVKTLSRHDDQPTEAARFKRGAQT